jgi:hypothetical protein
LDQAFSHEESKLRLYTSRGIQSRDGDGAGAVILTFVEESARLVTRTALNIREICFFEVGPFF